MSNSNATPLVMGAWEDMGDGEFVKKTLIETLPGWYWQDYSDGSGSMKAPDGRSFFAYDRQPYCSTGDIEYKDDLFRLHNNRPAMRFDYSIFGSGIKNRSGNDNFRQFKIAMEQNVLNNPTLFGL